MIEEKFLLDTNRLFYFAISAFQKPTIFFQIVLMRMQNIARNQSKQKFKKGKIMRINAHHNFAVLLSASTTTSNALSMECT
jgi:hypothetical protein